uniref:Uncharacterized protein n=1 Tax=Lepeophtheirus salmonis TaxID=72036 RepID=A0A0K2USM4_LEPSM
MRKVVRVRRCYEDEMLGFNNNPEVLSNDKFASTTNVDVFMYV